MIRGIVMNRILIFGVSGFAGRYMAKELVDNGYDVYGNSRLSATGVSDASDRFSVFYSGERGKQSGLSFHANESA